MPFTVAAQPVEAPQVRRQVQGTWTQVPVTRPAARPAPQPPRTGASSVGYTRPFWGCTTLLAALAFSAVAGWGVGALTDELLDLRELAMPFAVVAWLGGIILSVIVSRLVWWKRVRLPPRPALLPEE